MMESLMYVVLLDESSFGRFQEIWKPHDHMGVSKNRGTPKWMVYNGKPYQNG